MIRNKYALNYLFQKLINISNYYNYKLINSDDTYENFIYMMYHESNKDVINKNLYPEFFPSKFHSKGYEKYQILD